MLHSYHTHPLIWSRKSIELCRLNERSSFVLNVITLVNCIHNNQIYFSKNFNLRIVMYKSVQYGALNYNWNRNWWSCACERSYQSIIIYRYEKYARKSSGTSTSIHTVASQQVIIIDFNAGISYVNMFCDNLFALIYSNNDVYLWLRLTAVNGGNDNCRSTSI